MESKQEVQQDQYLTTEQKREYIDIALNQIKISKNTENNPINEDYIISMTNAFKIIDDFFKDRMKEYMKDKSNRRVAE